MKGILIVPTVRLSRHILVAIIVMLGVIALVLSG